MSGTSALFINVRPKLDFNVLATVMEHCGQKTKLVLSSTCRQLRKLSWMAYHHPVVLTTPETIYPFALFTFARLAMDRPCFYKLHELVVSLSFMTDQNRDYVDVFSRTLVYYDLLGLYLFQPELALFQHSDLFVTIAAQRKLTSLFIIGDIGPRTCQLMRAIESDLRVVELVQEGAYSDDDVVEVGQSLSPHADTLEWVTIAAGSILVAIDISDGMSTGIGPFPNMHTFALSDPGMVTDSASIMEIIPNLRILDVGAGWTVQSGWLPPSDIIDCAKERRSISKMDSREMSKDFTAARTTPPRWQNLELVRGGLWDLVWFGNTCRCKTLEITMVIPEYIVDQHRWLSVVVGDHAPEVLRFPLFVPFKVAHFRAATRRFSSVKSLYLCIKPVKIPANDGRFYVSLEELQKLLRKFRNLRRLYINTEILPEAQFYLAGCIASSTSLEFLGVRWTDPVSNAVNHRFWRITRPDSKAGIPSHIHELSFDAGKKVLEENGMLSDMYGL